MISIILATYNGTTYIKNAIESVLSQTFPDWELLIIDDGSTDNTREVVLEYAKKDPRIILLRNEENIGSSKSLNKGLQSAKGKYIARIDDDDRWIDKDKLKRQFEFLENNHEYIMVGTSAVVLEENGNIVAHYSVPKTDSHIRERMLIRNPFIHSSVLVRRDLMLEAGSYREQVGIKNAEDYDLWLRLGIYGKFFNITEPMTVYVTRKGNTSFNNKKDIFKSNIAMIKQHKDSYPNHIIALCLTYMKLTIYMLLSLILNERFRHRAYIFVYRQYLRIITW